MSRYARVAVRACTLLIVLSVVGSARATESDAASATGSSGQPGNVTAGSPTVAEAGASAAVGRGEHQASPSSAAALIRTVSGTLPELDRLQRQAALPPELREAEHDLPRQVHDVYEATEQARAQIRAATRVLDVVDVEYGLGRQLLSLRRVKSAVDAHVERASAAVRRVEAMSTEAEHASVEAQLLHVRGDVGAQLALVVREATRAGLEVQRSLASALRLQARLGELEDEISQVLGVAKTEGPSLGRDLTRTGPSAIAAWSPLRGQQSLLGSATAVLAHASVTFRDFLGSSAYRLLGHALVGVGLLLSLLWLRNKARSWTEWKGHQEPRDPLHRPYSVATLLTMAASPLLYPTAPASVVVLAFLGVGLSAVGLLRCLSSAIRPWHGRVLVSLLLVDVGRLLFVDLAGLEGLLLVGQGVLAAASLGLLLRTLRNGTTGHSRSSGNFQRLVLRFWLFAFSAGTLSLAFGLVHTGTILIAGATASLFAAIVWTTVQRITSHGLQLLLAGASRRHSTRTVAGRQLGVRRLDVVFGALWSFLWVRSTMQGFTVWEPASRWVRGVQRISLELGSLSVSLGSLVTLAVGAVLTVYGARVTRSILAHDVLSRTQLGPGTRVATSTAAYYGLLVAGAVVALGAAGVQLEKLTVILGALSVGVGFGLQNIVQNFLAGLILIFGRPINVEDRIQLGELTGIVVRIGFRASIVRTFQGADVIVPNADLISLQVINWTLSDPNRRLEIDVGVAYGSDVEGVLALLLAVARAHEDVISEPSPDALFLQHGSSSLDFRLRAWTSNAVFWPNVKSELTAGINRALREAGIQIPFPQRDIHIRGVVPKAVSEVTPK